MPQYLADFPRAAALGFQTAAEQPRVNPLGQFVRNMLADFQQRRAVGYELGGRLEVGKELAKYEAGLEAPLKEKLLKQDAITNAYKIAQQIYSDYIKNPDVKDQNPSLTAEALMQATFEDYMEKTGYSTEGMDVSSLAEKLKGTEAPIPKPKETTNIFKTLIPPEISPTAPVAEKVGGGIRTLLGGTAEATTKLPSRMVGAGAKGYNILADIMKGVTGIEQAKVPQDITGMLSRGELFDVPSAIEYYKRTIPTLFRRKR